MAASITDQVLIEAEFCGKFFKCTLKNQTLHCIAGPVSTSVRFVISGSSDAIRLAGEQLVKYGYENLEYNVRG